MMGSNSDSLLDEMEPRILRPILPPITNRVRKLITLNENTRVFWEVSNCRHIFLTGDPNAGTSI